LQVRVVENLNPLHMQWIGRNPKNEKMSKLLKMMVTRDGLNRRREPFPGGIQSN